MGEVRDGIRFHLPILNIGIPSPPTWWLMRRSMVMGKFEDEQRRGFRSGSWKPWHKGVSLTWTSIASRAWVGVAADGQHRKICGRLDEGL